MASAQSDSPAPLSLAALLAEPERYGERDVRVQGVVTRKTRAVFPNGRMYYALLVADGQSAVTVFSWGDPGVGEGDHVEVVGVFRIWRYNLRHVIESRRISRAAFP